MFFDTLLAVGTNPWAQPDSALLAVGTNPWAQPDSTLAPGLDTARAYAALSPMASYWVHVGTNP